MVAAGVCPQAGQIGGCWLTFTALRGRSIPKDKPAPFFICVSRKTRVAMTIEAQQRPEVSCERKVAQTPA